MSSEAVQLLRLNHFSNRLAAVEDWNGASRVVEESLMRIDAEDVIDRGEQVGRRDGSFSGVFALVVSRAHDLSRA